MTKVCHVIVVVGEKVLLQRPSGLPLSDSDNNWEPVSMPITRSGVSTILQDAGHQFLASSSSLHFVRSLPSTTRGRVLVAEVLAPASIETALRAITARSDLALFAEADLDALPPRPDDPLSPLETRKVLLSHARAILRQALGLDAPYALTPPWFRVGWAAAARAWIVQNLPEDAGGEEGVVITSFRSVEVGCVWRVMKRGAESERDIRQGWFFKAAPVRRTSGAVPETDYDRAITFLFCEEVALHVFLAETLGPEIGAEGIVPRVVSADRDRGFILMVRRRITLLPAAI